MSGWTSERMHLCEQASMCNARVCVCVRVWASEHARVLCSQWGLHVKTLSCAALGQCSGFSLSIASGTARLSQIIRIKREQEFLPPTQKAQDQGHQLIPLQNKPAGGHMSTATEAHTITTFEKTKNFNDFI